MVLRLGYLTTYDALDESSWPKELFGLFGAGHHLAKNLENESVLLDYLGPLEQNQNRLVTTFKKKFYYKVLKRVYESWAEPLVLQEYASKISRKLSEFNSDVVLCPENALPFSYLDCKQPIVLWTDATFQWVIDAYPTFKNLCNETRRNICELEKKSLERCERVVFLSDWAAQTAIQTYGIEASKIRIIPWGANIKCDRTHEDVKNLIDTRTAQPCKLLFIGLEWFRKGGDVALEVAKELNRRGLKTELLLVGCQPITTEPLPDFVKTIGFVDKYTEKGLQQLNQLFCESHFLILPSRAETFGHVLCEANSFGVPCLASKVGGMTTVIRDGYNGKTFALDAEISEYCNYVTSLMTKYEEYKQLAYSSFNEYQSRLNWKSAAQAVKQLLTELA